MAASLSKPPPTPAFSSEKKCQPPRLTRFFPSPVTLPLPFRPTSSSSSFRRVLMALKTGSDGLRWKPVIPDTVADGEEEEEEEEEEKEEEEPVALVDWEDQILEDTIPLVNLVRMILHSSMYESGDRLRPEHEKTIREKLLPFHPECEKKIGSGIDYITVGYHPDFDTSRCLFIVRKDGDFVDFSYWKCIKGFIRKNYPLFAESFILRHFSWRRHSSKPQ